jgi:hypothetical protein
MEKPKKVLTSFVSRNWILSIANLKTSFWFISVSVSCFTYLCLIPEKNSRIYLLPRLIFYPVEILSLKKKNPGLPKDLKGRYLHVKISSKYTVSYEVSAFSPT